MNLIAHASYDGRQQTLEEHAAGTVKIAGEFGAPIGMKAAAECAAALHDAGKASAEFQQYIRGNGDSVDHSTCGAQIAQKTMQKMAVPIEMAVMGHHTGLPNAMPKEDESSAIARLSKKVPVCLCAPKFTMPPYDDREAKDRFLYCKMLYSCLVDADYLDTEAFFKARPRQRREQSSYAEMQEMLKNYVAKFRSPTSLATNDAEKHRARLNALRNEIYDECERAGMTLGRGLYSCTVPTGGGKTLSTLGYALALANKDGAVSRIIYVSPYNSITSQTADVYRSVLGENNVLEHHSGVDYDSKDDCSAEKAMRWKQACENWDSRVIVTSSVQFFESLFSAKPSKSRRVHNIANSIVIIDEVQQLPLTLLRPCLQMIKHLCEYYGVTVLLCTATQPAFDIIPGLDFAAKEIISDPTRYAAEFSRCQIWYDGKITVKALRDRAMTSSQAIVIVNTRDTARDLYELFKESGEDEGVYHLSTRMTPDDRTRTLNKIKMMLREGKACHLISTSLVEAGVDIDFPTGFREVNGLDSVMQAAGRVNREWMYPADKSILHVVNIGMKNNPSDAVTRWSRMNEALKLGDSKDVRIDANLQIVRDYFRRCYTAGGADLDAKGILMLENKLSYAAVGEQFTMIDAEPFRVIVPYDADAQAALTELKKAQSADSLRHTTKYMVNLRAKDYAKLLKAQEITELTPGLAVLDNLSLYRHDVGIDV